MQNDKKFHSKDQKQYTTCDHCVNYFFLGVEQNKWTRIIEIICWILCTTFLILDIKKRISNLKKDNDPDDRV